MNRRDFTKTVGIGTLGLAAVMMAPAWGSTLPGHQQKKRKYWAWVTTDLHTPDDEWKKRFARLREAGVDAILPEIYNSREAYYQSRHLPVGDRWLEKILPLAKAEGLEVHAWMHTMECNVKDVVAQHPEWFVVNRKGESSTVKPAYVDYYKFLCPSRPEVHEFVQTIVRELAGYNELDGVHLDYIRYPDVILPVALQPKYGITQDREYPEYDYCYCDVCRRDFEKQSGIDPITMPDPSANQEWKQFRCDRITHLVNDTLIPVIHRQKKLATAAVFPNWENVRQQWLAWHLDAALPMLYHGFYNKGIDWIEEQTAKETGALQGRFPVYSGLFVPQLTAETLPQAIKASLAGGAAGVCLFAANSMSDDYWKAFRQTVLG